MTFAGVSRWYVAAYGDVAPGWRWLVRRGFRHCCAFGYCVALDRWVWVDASLTGMSIQFMDMDALVWRLSALRRLGCTILMGPDVDWNARRGGVKRGFWRVAPWCVAVTASVVGSSSRALRPHVFCRDLVRSGWVAAFRADDENPEDQGARRRSAGQGATSGGGEGCDGCEQRGRWGYS